MRGAQDRPQPSRAAERLRRVSCALLCVAAAACGSASGGAGPEASAATGPPGRSGPAADGAEPSPFVAALAREAEPAPASELVAPGGAFRASVRGRVGVAQVEAESVTFPIDLDAGSPAQCIVYSGPIDLADSLASTSSAIFRELPPSAALEDRRLDALGVDVHDGTPILKLSMLYRVSRSEGDIAGEIDLRAAQLRDRGILCLHDEVGYRETLDRLMADLIDTLEFEGEAPLPAPYYTEVAVVRSGAFEVGFTRTEYVGVAGSATRVVTRSSLALPVNAGELLAQDSVFVELSAADGSLLGSQYVQTSGGELQTQLALEPDPEGSWSVAGTFQQKELEVALGERSGLLSSLGQTLALRRAIADGGVGATGGYPVWVPDVDPTSFQDAQFSVNADNGDGTYAASQTVGPVRGVATVGTDGTTRSARIDFGNFALLVERRFVDGSL